MVFPNPNGVLTTGNVTYVYAWYCICVYITLVRLGYNITIPMPQP